VNRSIIVHGPQACGKTRNAVAIARHYGLSTILDDQDPHALPPGISMGTLVLTNVDLSGQHHIGLIRCIPYAQAAAASGVDSASSQATSE